MIFNRDNPFQAKLKARRRVTDQKSDKDVRHLVFDIGGSEMVHKCGDSLAVFPKNNIVEVAEILDALKIQPETEVLVNRRKMPIFTALHEHCNVTNVSRQFLEFIASHTAGIDEEMPQIGELAEGNGSAARSYTLLEILQKFDGVGDIGPNDLVENLGRLIPRLYSIASSQLLTPNEIHIVVNVINYVDGGGKRRHGVASSYLATMNIGSDAANIFIVNSMFAMPTDHSTDIIMVGPGTGIAPFRGFLQERKCYSDRGVPIGRSWLFFGDRHLATDFLFKDEILDFRDRGVLTNLHLAFSRDQDSKVYVQDRMLENREELWSWLLDGAYFYVCGNASRMAVDIDNTLLKIAMEVGRLSEATAKEFLQSLRKTRHYQRDVY
jgi:sulfite reductase (NADPH) flavoprotein alpha-component